MKKEIIIVIIILLLVIILDILTQRFTEKVMSEIENDLSQIREDIMQNNEDDLKSKIQNIIEKWNRKREILVIFIEHDELEKVEMHMIEIKSYIETKEYSIAVESIDTCNFVIEHIKDKYEFSIENIF